MILPGVREVKLNQGCNRYSSVGEKLLFPTHGALPRTPLKSTVGAGPQTQGENIWARSLSDLRPPIDKLR
jgi:hypothetical protein